MSYIGRSPKIQNLTVEDVLKFNSDNDAATGANATLTAPASPVVRLTNGGLTSIDMIPAGQEFQTVFLINATGVDVTINDNTGATAANRILTGQKAAVTLKDEMIAILIYDSTETRWMLIASLGGGASGFVSQTSSTGAAVMPAGTVAQRPGSPVGGYLRYNQDTDVMEFYNDATSQWHALKFDSYIVATGGTITTDGNYRIHTFTSSDNFIVSNAGNLDPTVEYLVIGGGAGGAANASAFAHGGGGAGGYRTATGFTVTAQTYAITVGAGGASGSSGSASVFSTISSAGGGVGGGSGSNGTAGGSGGGGGFGASGGAGNTPSTSPSQGNNGGNGAGGGNNCAGGGGGAGAVGQNSDGITGGNGGNGTASSITGSSVTRAGGGGGGAITGQTPGSGGTGGGGAGGNSTGTSGTANTGGGGGGGYQGSNSGAGGSGVVIIRYRFQ